MIRPPAPRCANTSHWAVRLGGMVALPLCLVLRAAALEGGPDAFGYTWRDSRDSPGPVFEWVDISASGSTLQLTDNSYAGPIPIPFPFPFYGEFRGDCYLSANGVITFGSANSSLQPQCPPAAGEPDAWIAFLWEDLHPVPGGAVRYRIDQDLGRLIFQFTAVNGACGEPVTVQAQLLAGGVVKLQYQELPPACAGLAAVGVEGMAGASGLAYRCPGEGLDLPAGLAIEFAPPSPCDSLDCAGDSETEPNGGWTDGNASWNEIVCGQALCGSIHANVQSVDSDWFLYRHFGGNITATLTTADFDGQILLCRQELAGDTVRMASALPRCFGETLRMENLPMGLYYLVVSHAGAPDVAGEQGYRLSLGCDGHACSDHLPVVCTGTAEAEPNEGWNADPPNSSMGEAALGGQVCGEVWADGGLRDMDWFHLSLTGPADLLVELAPDAFDAALFLTDLEPTGQVLAAVNESGLCQPEHLVLPGLAAGDYLVAVGPATGWGVPVPQRYTCRLAAADPADPCQSTAALSLPAGEVLRLDRPAPFTGHHDGGGCPGGVSAPGRDEVFALHLDAPADLSVTMQGAGDADEVLLLLGDCRQPATTCIAAARAQGPAPAVMELPGLPAGDYWLVADFAGAGEAVPYHLELRDAATGTAAGQPGGFALEPCHPNPFNPVTTVAWTQPVAAPARLLVHDLRGARIDARDLGWMPAGRHELRWDAAAQGSGVYLLTLEAGGERRSVKALLLK